MRFYLAVFVACVVAAIVAPRDAAATIVAPISAEVSSTQASIRIIGKTFDQSGLSYGYISGATDFDSYINRGVKHDIDTFNAWFSSGSDTAPWVIYNLGSQKTIDGFAFWNGPDAGILKATLSTSVDGQTYQALMSIEPQDHGNDSVYPADVFNFAAIDFQYFRIDISECRVNPVFVGSCSIGEVAFREVSAVPLPAALPLFLTALAWLGLAGWRRARITNSHS